ncbi:probable tubulin polyglutamylase ttll-15 [Phymastichus coffea]|uniref:probable tubulin polyglutamylase ttll-15 n=1 Tax=Phymastichus coffea TaxID=108790 RepID=UPI00273B2AC4|nr:probable tubulin polyglutamylase ttll-15 [Phymastichus coffea]
MEMKEVKCRANGKKAEDGMRAKVLDTKVKELAKIFLVVIVGPAVLYTLFFVFLHYQSHLTTIKIKEVAAREKKPVYWVYGRDSNEGHLKHVFAVLGRLGFERGSNESDWDLLWAHDYPFRALYPSLNNLKPHQKVNHFPGCGYITNKVDLSTTEGKFMPRAFKIPEQRAPFLEYVKQHPEMIFVQKSNSHRGIKIQKVDNLNLTTDGSFVQQFIEKPFLVDGYKFDIGIYTVITSIDPLRVYAYKGDVLFRFCPIKYYPFDSEQVDKYVVGDDYLPIWNVPSLKNYYTNLGFSMKESFDSYVRSKGKDPQKMWEDCFKAITSVILKKEAHIRDIVKRFKTSRNFFELVRFDFTIDEDLNVFMMEANMSPNLSSAHYPPNQLLYEQVLYNLFALIGVGQRVRKDSLKARNVEEEDMITADKNLVVLPDICSECDDCFKVECQLCKPCFTEEMKLTLTQSYWEHQNKMDYLRIFPPPITKDMVLKDYSLRNQLLIRWFQGKCELDPTWCE